VGQHGEESKRIERLQNHCLNKIESPRAIRGQAEKGFRKSQVKRKQQVVYETRNFGGRKTDQKMGGAV